jgi:hypothetical protein
MKKILGSLVVAIALWAGATAIIGNQTEHQVNGYIEKINTLYQQNGLNLKMTDYNRTFLNSTAVIELDITDSSAKELLSEVYTLPLKMNYTIEHGPIFFQNGLGFGLSKAHQKIALSSILRDEGKEEFLNLVHNKDVMIEGESVVSFFKKINSKILSDEIKIDENGTLLTIAPFIITNSLDLDTLQGDGHFILPMIFFKEKEDNRELHIENMVVDMQLDGFIEDILMLGKIDFSVDRLYLNDKNNTDIGEIDMATKFHLTTQKDSDTTMKTLFEGSVDLTNTNLPNTLPALKTLTGKINIEGLGIEGMVMFQKTAKEMETAQTALVAKMQEQPEQMDEIFAEFGKIEEEMLTKIVYSLNTLLIKDKSVVKYEVIANTKEGNESQASIEIGYTGDMNFTGSFEEMSTKIQQDILKLFRVNVDMHVDANLLKGVPNTENLMQQIQMGVAQGLIKEENGQFILNGYYKNEELMVNDNNLTATILPFLMMATQGGM